MNLAHLLLQRVGDPNLTDEERARLRYQSAKQLEEAGNYEAAREIMGELWQGVGHRPVVEGLEERTAAEVILRAGVLTGWIGSCKQIEEAQEEAKNLISESITRFGELQDTEKVAEAQMELGYCYWRQGAINEARVWLRAALDRLTTYKGEGVNEVRAVALLRLAIVEYAAKRFNDALRICIEAAPLFERITSHAIKGRFYSVFGMVLRNLGAVERRADYIDRALIEYAAASFHFDQAGHTRYQGNVENNLGFLFGTIRKFAEAHEHLDRAQALFTGLKDKVHVAQVDETRARVLLEEGRVVEAEKLARTAVQALEGGDQQFLLAEALTTHGVTLARLDRHQPARLTLQSAVEVAQNAGDSETAGGAALTIIEELGEYLTADDLSMTFQRASDLLTDSRDPATLLRLTTAARRVLFITGASPAPATWENFSLRDAVRRYEKGIIERALADAGGVVTRAAQLLGYSHSTLIKKLNNQYPELLSERTPVKPRRRSLIFIRNAGKETRSLSLLHVEDDESVADVVKDTLELEGWTVEVLRDGASALQRLQSEAVYDLLIFDNELPGMSGVELIRRTRRLPHRQQTPIIMLSGDDVELEARRAGASAFLKKPDDLPKVAETIARLLARKPKHTRKGRYE
jgi:CheY-like chemotaxis protein/tetratricopeptide (TPR) repeat protein